MTPPTITKALAAGRVAINQATFQRRWAAEFATRRIKQYRINPAADGRTIGFELHFADGSVEMFAVDIGMIHNFVVELYLASSCARELLNHTAREAEKH